MALLDSASTPYLIGSVDKALVVLRLLHDDGPLGVSELAERLDVARSTAHRLLGTLMHHGFVEQDRMTRNYRLGPFFTQQGVETKAVLQLRAIAMPTMRTLSAEFDETVQLTVLEGANCRFVDGVSGNRPLKTSVQSGSVLPAYATASGKALLAELDDETVSALYTRKKLPTITGHTVPTMATLLDQLARIRRDGYSLNDGETEDGVGALAVPVRGRSGHALGAIAFSLPTVRMRPENTRRMLPRLIASAAAISETLTASADLQTDIREGRAPWS
jgi:DNA-binding IclR family transcriptional regulator